MQVIQGKPEMKYPARVPLKVFGQMEVFRAEQVVELILAHLGPQPEGDLQGRANCKGAFVAYTFWVTLPDEGAEAPLREAISRLPGVVMQL